MLYELKSLVFSPNRLKLKTLNAAQNSDRQAYCGFQPRKIFSIVYSFASSFVS